MKKDTENKGKFGFGLLTKKEDQPEENLNAETNEKMSDSEEEEEAAEVEGEGADDNSEVGEEGEAEEESEEEEEAPAWLETVLEGCSAEGPDGICKVPDKELLKIKGIGKGTLNQIREVYPYQEPKRSGKVMIEVLPMRGIGGVGKAGTQAEMDWEQAEQYVREGYVKILD